MPDLAANQNAGAIAACERCGDPCRVATKTNPDARLLKHATEPKGFCANCAVAEWFSQHEMISQIGDLPNALLIKPIQEQFMKVMIAGGADMKPNEITWTKVGQHWNLPFPKRTKTRRTKKAAK